MKLKFSLKSKEAMLEADVEGMLEKGLQHQAKKPPKKTKYQIKQEEIRKNKELEQKHFLQGMLLMLAILVVIIVICMVGAYFE